MTTCPGKARITLPYVTTAFHAWEIFSYTIVITSPKSREGNSNLLSVIFCRLVMILAALKNVGLVLVYSRQDNVRMTALSIGIGSFMALTQLVISECSNHVCYCRHCESVIPRFLTKHKANLLQA